MYHSKRVFNLERLIGNSQAGRRQGPPEWQNFVQKSPKRKSPKLRQRNSKWKFSFFSKYVESILFQKTVERELVAVGGNGTNGEHWLKVPDCDALEKRSTPESPSHGWLTH